MAVPDVLAYVVITLVAMSVGHQLYTGWRILRGKMSIQEMLESHYLIDRD